MKSPRAGFLAEVEQHRGMVAHWEAERAAAMAELESLQERAGEEVLADASAASRLSRSMQELRDRVDIAQRAVDAATPKLHAAAVEALLAEAVEVEAEQARAQTALDEFDARQAKLLGALEAFTGLSWVPRSGNEESTVELAVSSPNAMPPTVAQRPVLERALETCRRTAWALREVAAGRDPHQALRVPFEGPRFVGLVNGPDPRIFYTDSTWGSNAVLPAPAYTRSTPATGAVDPDPATPATSEEQIH
ncbi:hypothetical protein ACIA49_03525 [Kribbella sp. NPDC051587]|uniref:hypothetical protein n=1 Tax=Kribbella sp. NPDC051587 TaxID=3364119 RepID=UPI0037A9DD9D